MNLVHERVVIFKSADYNHSEVVSINKIIAVLGKRLGTGTGICLSNINGRTIWNQGTRRGRSTGRQNHMTCTGNQGTMQFGEKLIGHSQGVASKEDRAISNYI